jgi:hypothetical protein
MALTFEVCLDCHHPEALARFWAVALGYVPEPPPRGFATWEDFARRTSLTAEEAAGFAAVVDPDGAGPRMFFHRVPQNAADGAPPGPATRNRLHLDLHVSAGLGTAETRAAAVHEHVRRCRQAGASVLRDVHDQLGAFIVMADPEGNEFCVH